MPTYQSDDALKKKISTLEMQLAVFRKCSNIVSNFQGFDEAARSIFNACKGAVGATSGYVALLSDDGTQNEILFLDSGGLPCSVDPALPMPIRGLRAEATEMARTVIENDFPNSRWVAFMPKGHVDLGNVMFAPMIIEGKVHGVLGLANKTGGFTRQDADVVTVFGEFAAIALRRARAQDRRRRPEQSLIESEARFRKLYTTMKEGVCLHEIVYNDDEPVEYRILDVNPAYEDIIGLKKDDVVGRTSMDVYNSTAPPALDIYAQVAASGQPAFFEFYFAPLDKHFQVSAFSPSKGQFATVFNDISDQKRKEQQLRISEEYLSTTLSSIGDAVITADTNGNIVRMNPVAETLTGWSASEATGQPLERVFAILNEKTREPSQNPVETVLREGDIVGLANNTVLVSRDGKEYFIGDSAAPIRSERGDVIGVVLIFRDISGRKRAEAERERLLFAIDQANELVVITDAKGTMQFINPAFERITGYPREEAMGQNPRILNSGKHDIAFYKKLWDTILNGNPWTGRMINRRKDGSMYTGECSISPIKNEHGEIVNFVWISRDITEELELGKRVNQAQKMEAIGSLAGGIAHDFNNLLFPIIGMSEMLLEDIPEDDLNHENVEEILQAARRAGDLVKQILSFSRQTDQKKTPVRIQQILREVYKLARSSIPSSIDIVHNFQSDCGLVLADPSQIHQVAMNLITNAFHAVEKTDGTISMELREIELAKDDTEKMLLEPGKYAVICISDTGHGIPGDVMGKIFEPYFTTKTHGKGTGLGLSVVYGIVNEHGGDIRATSDIGKGTTFTIYLPIMEKVAVMTAPDREVTYATGTESILLVDDEAAVLRMEKQILARLGYTVVERTSSIEALNAFRAAPDSFDLVITDMTMPNMTGDQLTEALIAIRPDIPIIVCTGFSEKINAEKATALGVKGFLMKPVIRYDMAQMVRNVLDASAADKRRRH